MSATITDTTRAGSAIRFRSPTPEDGADLWRLVRDAGTLELNSPYTYILMASHFADTCLVAEADEAADGDDPLGLVIAYRPPTHRDAVFVWQVAVSPAARGRGLGRRLLEELVERLRPAGVRFLEASVTPGNEASRALFRSLAREAGVPCRVEEFMTEDLFPEAHEAEELFRIGPFEAPMQSPEDTAGKPRRGEIA